MPSVVCYWQLPEEEEKFLAYLDKTGDVVACTIDGSLDPTDLTPRPLTKLFDEAAPERVVFTLREFMDLAEITSYQKDGRRWYHRYYMNGPLIDYTRPRWWEPQRLVRADLTFETRVLISDGANEDLSYWQPQPPEFLTWARRVHSWVRRHTQPHGPYPRNRASPGVLAALDGGLTLYDG